MPVADYLLEDRDQRETQYRLLLFRTFGNSVDGAFFGAQDVNGVPAGQLAVNSVQGFRTVEEKAQEAHYVHE